MQEPAIPVDEHERLSALRAAGLLDTQAEERFDRVARMAQRLFGVPIALVSLVDAERQWFKSCFGLDVLETERRVSFCAHAILGEGTMVVEDTHGDDRFVDNPLVCGEPNIRFYAGHPLRGVAGHAFGTLCIIDREPRRFPAEDRVMLADLAEMVEREINAVQLALTDELTRISNRRGFVAVTRNSLEICRRQGLNAFLVFFDLDRFKEINDLYGHAEGDRVLLLFADQMRRTFRSSDALARFGGDEFVVLLTDVEVTLIHDLIQRFRAGLELACAERRLPYGIHFSYGVVAFESPMHASIEDLLNAADSAMYQQKSTHRDVVPG